MDAPTLEAQDLIASLDPTAKVLFAEAVLGRDVHDFLTSELGRYIIGCAEQEYRSAIEKLETTPAWRWRRVRDLQNQMWRAKSLLSWLRDLLVAGQSAEHVLDDLEHEQ